MFQSQDGTYAMKKVLILIKEQLGLVREELVLGTALTTCDSSSLAHYCVRPLLCASRMKLSLRLKS